MVDDLADAHVLALQATNCGSHRIFNLGNGTGFSVRQVIAVAEGVTGVSVRTNAAPRRPGDPARLVAASDLIRSELGWEPRKPALEEIVADAWAFAQTHPNGYAQ